MGPDENTRALEPTVNDGIIGFKLGTCQCYAKSPIVCSLTGIGLGIDRRGRFNEAVELVVTRGVLRI